MKSENRKRLPVHWHTLVISNHREDWHFRVLLDHVRDQTQLVDDLAFRDVPNVVWGDVT